MKKLFLFNIWTFLILTQPAVAATAPDPYDKVLIAYKLTPDQENLFSNHDGVTSSFWSTIIGGAQYDNARLVPSHNAALNSNFQSEEDAQLMIWATWGSKGLYVLADVVDDSWDVCDPAESCGGGDLIDLCFDEYSSSFLKSHPSLFYLLSITKTTVSYSFFCDPSEYWFRFLSLDSSWDTTSTNLEMSLMSLRYSIPQGESAGIYLEQFFNTGDPHLRRFEILIPWRHFSYHGITLPDIGQRNALSIGYEDGDTGITEGLNILHWDSSGDPFMANPEIWGDIEFGPYLSDVGIQSFQQTLPTQRPASIIKTEYFALDGRKIQPIRNQAFMTKKRVAVVRTVDTHGVARFEQRLIDQ